MAILVTGGTGYIGSHTCVSLLNSGYEVVALDNFSNSCKEVLHRIKQITGKEVRFYEADVCDKEALHKIFSAESITAVIHFAGLKAVGESVAQPLKYYQNNVAGTFALCEVMQEHGVKNIIFSSSATVYGDPERVPIQEGDRLGPTNPYGQTKRMIELLLEDLYVSDKEWNAVILRYFNPVGAHPSGLMGENPKGIPNNLTPYITQVAVGKREFLPVFGDDYNTPDGSGVRDYLHVVDLADGHVCAIKKIDENCGLVYYNLGTGNGYSVFEMIKGFEQAVGRPIPYKVQARRPGDIPTCYADPSKAKAELHWEAKQDLLAMCADAWRWQQNNPNGYDNN